MSFISPFANLQMMLLSDRHPLPWITTEKLVYESPLTGDEYEVLQHFRTDLASIPKALILLPGIGQAAFMRFFGAGVWMGAREAVLHDYLRRPDKAGRLPVPAKVAHLIFREALYEAGYPPDLCEAYYAAVVAFNS